MRATHQLIGSKFEKQGYIWWGCAIGNDGCMYAVPTKSGYRQLLRIDPSNDSTELVGPDLGWNIGWLGCITGPDACIYGFPNSRYSDREILKFDPITQEVTMIQVTASGNCYFAVVGVDGMIYFISEDGAILLYDPVNHQSNSMVTNIQQKEGLYGLFSGAVMADDGCIYLIPFNHNQVMRFNPSDGSTTFIGDNFEGGYKWRGAVLGSDGNVYGIPWNYSYILKIDVAAQTTSLVGPDLGREGGKYDGGVLGRDNCIYLIPRDAKFVLKFNPKTGITSTVGKSLGNVVGKYNGGELASNGYIYLTPGPGAKQVLKVQSWDNWVYLKPRLLVEKGRAEGKIIQPGDDELNIVQHFIIHSIDDVFRTVLEMM